VKNNRYLLLLFVIFGICNSSWAQATHVSLCALQENPEKFLNSKVQVEVLIYAGVEYPRLTAGECSFRFARGDNYQLFGDRFQVSQDEQWKLLTKLLSVSECASNVRVAKALVEGTVIRVPATGTRLPNEMPMELVIQAVSEVSHVPTKCTPPNTQSTGTLVHEGSHADPPKQQ